MIPSFVHGPYLWFAAGMAIPLIIHLLNRQRFRRERWAAMQFLLAAIKKTRRRIQIENVLLLLIRMLVMGLLAAAVARPFFRETPFGAWGDSDVHYIFVLDNSMSMGYKRAQATALEIAKRRASEILDQLNFSSDNRFTLVLLNQFPEVRVDNVWKREVAQAAVQETELSDYATSMPDTLAVIAETIDRSPKAERKVYVFTDFQAGAWRARSEEEEKRFAGLLARYSQGPENRFFFYDVGDEDPQNSGIVSVRVRDRLIVARRKVPFEVTIHNYSALPIREERQVKMFVDGEPKDTASYTVDPNSSRTVTFEYEFEPGPHRVKFECVTPDFLPRDDVRYFALDVRETIRLLLVDGDPQPGFDDETRLLEMALDPSREGRRYKIDVKTTETFPADELSGYDAVLAANCKDFAPDKVEKLKEYVKNGGGLFIALGAKIGKEFYNSSLFEGGKGLLPARLAEVKGLDPTAASDEERPIFLDKIRYEHPMFRICANPNDRTVLKGIAFYQYWGTEQYDPAHVLAIFEDPVGSPAFLEKTFGEGRVILFTSSVTRAWNTLPALAPFVPLVNELARYLASRPLTSRNLFLGDTLQFVFPVEKWAAEMKLRRLDPETAGDITISPERPPKEQRMWSVTWPTHRPERDSKNPPKASELKNEGVKFAGHYRLAYADTKEDKPLAYFAFNVSPSEAEAENFESAEGNLKRISPEEIHKRFPKFKYQLIGGPSQGSPAGPVVPPASNLWKGILIAILVLLGVESILACLFGRKQE